MPRVGSPPRRRCVALAVAAAFVWPVAADAKAPPTPAQVRLHVVKLRLAELRGVHGMRCTQRWFSDGGTPTLVKTCFLGPR